MGAEQRNPLFVTLEFENGTVRSPVFAYALEEDLFHRQGYNKATHEGRVIAAR